jgi:calcineurin-like phosphoesterase family protein
MNLYTADLHLGHPKIIKYDGRPFDSVEEHDDTIIDNINSVTKKGDVLYVLGDFCWARTTDDVNRYIDRLNGNIHLVLGNHDHKKTRRAKFGWIGDYKKIKKPLRMMLSHYPMVHWDSSCHGSYMLHGHCHGSYVDKTKYILDVGINSHNYMPWTEEEIEAEMSTRTVNLKNHHELNITEGE